MDPKHGLLNIAANLPDSIQIPNFGPCLNISYRSGEEYAQPDSVKKLGFETCDMVSFLNPFIFGIVFPYFTIALAMLEIYIDC